MTTTPQQTADQFLRPKTLKTEQKKHIKTNTNTHAKPTNAKLSIEMENERQQ